MMNSKLRAAVLMVGLSMPAGVDAQQLSAHVATPITITVRPTLVIRSVVPTAARVEPATSLTSATVVHVESNLPYRVAVRLAPTTSNAARVFIRGADGRFESLVPGASVTTVVSRTGGQRGHEVLCRVDSSDTDRCALIYELSAEYDDVLIRSVAK